MTEVTQVPLPPQVQDQSDNGSKRLLVVDDEPAALVITSRMLQGAGFETLQVPSAREALRVLDQGHPRVDLVITDVVMPETDGRMLGRLIAERYPGLPVIYMSAYTAEDIFHRGSPGPDLPFIRKPFPPELLVELVQKHLVV
jgi:two-component system cell cycle sensor histidine kinase/response regulator CckA